MQKIYILSTYIDVLVPDGKRIYQRPKSVAFDSMCDFPDKYIKLPKWSSVLKFCSDCPGIFVPDE